MAYKSNASSAAASEARPWWRFGYLWLIIGLTLAMFAAGGVTVYLAMQTPLQPVAMEAVGGAGAADVLNEALEPAMQARNRTSSRNAKELSLDGK